MHTTAGKHLDFILVLFQPCRGKPAMMDLQIIQNQEHFLLRFMGQAPHEAGQPLLVRCVLIDYKMNLALTADRRDYIDPLPLRFYWQHGRMPLR